MVNDCANGADMDVLSVKVPSHIVLLGFGKFKWAQLKSDDDVTEYDIKYEFGAMSEEAVLNGSLMTLDKMIITQRGVDPTLAKVTYHDLIEQPTAGCPHAFKLVVKHRVVARVPEQVPIEAKGVENESTLTQANAGLTIPVRLWRSYTRCKVFWIVKWTRKGLSPVVPKVLSVCSISLGPNEAISLA